MDSTFCKIQSFKVHIPYNFLEVFARFIKYIDTMKGGRRKGKIRDTMGEIYLLKKRFQRQREEGETSAVHFSPSISVRELIFFRERKINEKKSRG